MVSVISVLRFNTTATPGKYTITAPQPNSFRDDKGNPSQAGDVLSVQPNGDIQVRRAGTEGVFELCQRDGLFGIYQIDQNSPITVIAPTGF